MTEFVILYEQARNQQQQQGVCVARATLFGSPMYVAFTVAYFVVAGLSLFQFARVVYFSRCHHWLMAVEHALVIVIALCRAVNMVLYYALTKYLALEYVTIITAMPDLLASFVFTFIIFAWAAIWHGSKKAERTNPFRELQPIFIAVNACVVGIVFVLYVLTASASDPSKVESYALAGVLVQAITACLQSIFFILYGGLLVRSLTQDFSSSYASKLFVIAVMFCLAFMAESLLLFVTVLKSDVFTANFDAINGVYFGLDVFCLCTVMALFRKSVSDLHKAGKAGRDSSGAKTRHSAAASKHAQHDAPSRVSATHTASRQPRLHTKTSSHLMTSGSAQGGKRSLGAQRASRVSRNTLTVPLSVEQPPQPPSTIAKEASTTSTEHAHSTEPGSPPASSKAITVASVCKCLRFSV